jgi:hypothetical protein
VLCAPGPHAALPHGRCVRAATYLPLAAVR